MRILLEGQPASGKSTIARRLADTLTEMGIPVTGFVTQEIRERRRSIGLRIERIGGERAGLAQVDLPGPPRVGRWGADCSALERLAIPAMREATDREVAIVDEPGGDGVRVHSPFRDAGCAVFDRQLRVVATVQTTWHPYPAALKRRPPRPCA